jgi:fluoroacetyl-CoA thioesterase
MARRTLPPGATGSATLVVARSDLANQLSAEHEGLFPPVFATARMVAFMELAAGRALAPILEEGEVSVGVSIDVRHTAATAVGSTVRATARFVGVNGKFYRFEVTAEDDGGEIGRGTHERAIVESGRLLAGAQRRSRV